MTSLDLCRGDSIASTQGRISRLGSKRTEAHSFSRPTKPSGDVFNGKDTNLLCNLSAQWKKIT